MTSATGNVTYKYRSVTGFYNATVKAVTQTTSDGTTGNTSVWYGFDNSTFTIINSTIQKGYTMSSAIPVNGVSEFYVMLKSDTDNFNSENPIVLYKNKLHYQDNL